MDQRSVREAILRKSRESAMLNQGFFESHAERIEALCSEMAQAFLKGGRLFTMGNGGSACDAMHVAVEFNHPIVEKRKQLPAISLINDTATITAISNDLDFSRIFVQQLKGLARRGDMALVISTSGKSPNLIYGLQAAREIGMITIALTGKDGGRMPDLADFCFVVPSFSIHRIQEVHVALLHVIWDLVHVSLGEQDVL
jgi:D-sedoheptulose 7-phosphate isomerase